MLLAGDEPQEGRLAGAVRPDHPDDPARREAEAEVVDEDAVAVGLAQAPGFDHVAAEPGPGRYMDLDLIELDVAVLGEQRLVGVQPRLRLVPPGAGIEAHPLELLLDRPLARALLTGLLLEAPPLLLEPPRVVALVRNAPAAIELEDPAGDVVEE